MPLKLTANGWTRWFPETKWQFFQPKSGGEFDWHDGTLGPWGGEGNNYPKIPVLAFIAPQTGSYKITGTAKSKPWDGGAKTFPLSLLKKDTQRAAEIVTVQDRKSVV